MARKPHFIGADMGSIDPGPYYLGSGEMAAPEEMVRRDLSLVLRAALAAGIPLASGEIPARDLARAQEPRRDGALLARST